MDWDLALYFIVLIAAIAYDFVWGEYVKAIAVKDDISASFHAAILMGSSGFVTYSFVHDLRLLIPACVGAMIGTYASVNWKRT